MDGTWWNWHRKIKLFNKTRQSNLLWVKLSEIILRGRMWQTLNSFGLTWFNIFICWTTRMVQVRFNNAAKRFVSWLWVMSSPKHQLLKSLTFGIFRATQRELCRWYHHPKPGVFHIGDVKIRGYWSELCSAVHCVAERGQHRQHRQLQNRRESLRNPSLMVRQSCHFDKGWQQMTIQSKFKSFKSLPFGVLRNNARLCLRNCQGSRC